MREVSPPSTVALTRPLPIQVRYSDGALEVLKWIALVLMTADHINAGVFKWAYPWVFNLGRVVMPIFAVVLAYNLARPSTTRETYHRLMLRLAIAGALAQPAYVFIHGYWPLNILATLLLTTAIIYFIQFRPRYWKCQALVLFVVGGAFVEFWWMGIAVGVTAGLFFREPTERRMAWLIVAIASLGIVNRNLWCLWSLPVLLAGTCWRLPVQRYPLVFYAYYPLHLSAIGIGAFALRHGN